MSSLALAVTLVLLATAPGTPEARAEELETFLHSDLGGGTEGALPRHLIWALTGIAPELFGHSEAEFFQRYGMIRDPASPEGLPYGLVPVKDRAGVPYLALNCAWCHVGRIAGKTYFGLGNRELLQADMTRDLVQMGVDPRFTPARVIAAARKEAYRRRQLWRLIDSAELTAAVAYFQWEARQHWVSDNTPVGPGLSLAAVIAQEKRFHRPLPPKVLPMVKIPTLWSYGARKTFSVGGNFVGDVSRSSIAPEFGKGRSAADLIAHPEPFRAIYRWMLATPPPRYPFPIDPALKEEGEDVYAAECLPCHGTNQLGNYRETLVPWDDVRTDPDRIKGYGPQFQADVRALHIPDSDFVYTNGYVPPQHDGLWTRAPYLHNASVPSLRWMLEPPQSRPVIFYVGGEQPYDSVDVGNVCRLTVEDGVKACAPDFPGQRRYDTRQQGRGNGGHPFGTNLSAVEKRALLEYLKTL